MNNFLVREATINDVDFLVETIIQAERSGTDKLSYSTLFDLQESEVRDYLAKMLKEDIDGCEFSISSFLVIDFQGKLIAAIGGWLEAFNEDNMPSSLLKSNLISYCFPKQNMIFANSKSELLRNLHINREKGIYQIEFVYVDKDFRGKNYVSILLEEHIKRCKTLNCKIIEVQLSANNIPALRYYEKAGFSIYQLYCNENEEVLKYLPSNKKILMRKVIH